MNILAVGEFIVSNNFLILLTRLFNLPNHFIEMGAYQQGIPIRPIADFVWGSNSGLRTLPILSSLLLLQKLFPTNWDYVYLGMTILLSFVMFCLALSLTKKVNIFIILGALFYCGNLWIIDRIFSGFWQLNIVYSFLPFLITIPLKIAAKENLPWKNLSFWAVLYGALWSIIIIAQPHFLIMTGIFSIIHLLTLFLKKDYFHGMRLVIMYSTALLIFLLVNAYHIVPGALYPERIFTAPNQYFSLNAVASNGAHSQLSNVLRLETVWYYPYTEFKWTFLEYLQLIPIAITLLLFIINKKRSWLYATCLCVFLFLAKAFHAPGENISRWIYQHIVFMHFFRDPSRFLGGAAVFMSFIIADFSLKKPLNKWWKIVFVIIAMVILIIVNMRNISVPRIATLSRTHIPDEYIKLQNFTAMNIDRRNEGRALPLPNFQGINAYSWYSNPLPLSSGTVFDMLVPLNIPLVSTAAYPDSYSNQLTAFLYTKYIASYDTHYLAPLGIKYLITDNSATKVDSAKAVATTSAEILKTNSTNYHLLYKNNIVSLFENNNFAPIVSTQKPLFAIGDLNTIAKSYESGSTRPVILLNQMVNSSVKDLSVLKNEDIFFDADNPYLVLTAERLSHHYSADILGAGWDYDKIFSNFEPSKMSYIQNSGELFTSGRAVISQTTGFMHVKQSIPQGRYKILIKALTDSSPATLTINISNSKKDIQLDTNKHLRWTDAGSITVNHPVSFLTLTKPDPNLIIIDYLLFVPEKQFDTEEKNVTDTLSTMSVVKDLSVQNQSTNPYPLIGEDRVTITHPARYITYRYSYGDYWRSNKPSTTFISDLYGMTFIANNNTIQEIEYYPNNQYKLSIILSAISLAATLLFIGYDIYFYVRKLHSLSKQ